MVRAANVVHSSRCMHNAVRFLVRWFNGEEIWAAHFQNQINFCEENFCVCLWKRPKQKRVVKKRKRRNSSWVKQEREKNEVVYDRERNMTDINAILLARSPFSRMAESEVCIAAWLKVLLEVQQTHYDDFHPLHCCCLIRITQQRLLKNSQRCNFSNSHRNSSNNKLFYVKMIYLRK